MRRHGSGHTVYVALGTGDSLHVGVTSDPARHFAILHEGRHLPKALRDRQPVRIVFQLGPFPTAQSGAAGRSLLQRLEPARLRALLAGSRQELSSLACHFPGVDLRHRAETDSVEPLDLDHDLPLPACPAQAAAGPAAALLHLQDHLEPRRWRVFLARRRDHRTRVDIGREEGRSTERIRQAEIVEVTRRPRSRVELRRVLDPAKRCLEDAFALARVMPTWRSSRSSARPCGSWPLSPSATTRRGSPRPTPSSRAGARRRSSGC